MAHRHGGSDERKMRETEGGREGRWKRVELKATGKGKDAMI